MILERCEVNNRKRVWWSRNCAMYKTRVAPQCFGGCLKPVLRMPAPQADQSALLSHLHCLTLQLQGPRIELSFLI